MSLMLRSGRRPCLDTVQVLLAAAGLGLFPPGAAAADASPGRGGADLDRARFIAVEEIKPGMRGVGRSTFSGQGVEEFAVEVLGVLRHWSPGGDLIVVEASGGPLGQTGIFRGMSGSPVYLDGRLAGAIAYNLGGFAERPIAGVTPIAEMLPLLARSLSESGSPTSDVTPSPRSGRTSPATDAAGRARTALGTQDSPPAELAARLGLSGADVEPIRTPLVLAGFTAEARAAMGSFLSGWGIEAVSGGASGAAPEADRALEPGAPVGVQLVRGDVEATALGTITLVDGDRVLAFGHPMFQAGDVDLPMTTAEVLTIYPSQAISFVIGAADQPVGHVTVDQLAGIAGRIGPAAPMVPMEIRVRSAVSGERTYRFEIVRNKFFLSQFVGVLALNSFAAEQKIFGEATLDLSLAVELSDGARLEVRDVLATIQAPAVLAEKVASPVTSLLFNGIIPVDIRRVDVDIDLRPELRAATIEEVIIDQETIKAGESITATVFLKPHTAARRSLEVTIPVPTDAVSGPALLRFCAADEAASWEAERAPRRFVPATIEQLVELVEETSSHHLIRATLHSDAKGVVVAGREMQGLPASVFRVMDSNRRAGGRSGSWGRLLHEERVPTDYQLSGCQELRLDIDGKRVAAGGGEP